MEFCWTANQWKIYFQILIQSKIQKIGSGINHTFLGYMQWFKLTWSTIKHYHVISLSVIYLRRTKLWLRKISMNFNRKSGWFVPLHITSHTKYHVRILIFTFQLAKIHICTHCVWYTMLCYTIFIRWSVRTRCFNRFAKIIVKKGSFLLKRSSTVDLKIMLKLEIWIIGTDIGTFIWTKNWPQNQFYPQNGAKG